MSSQDTIDQRERVQMDRPHICVINGAASFLNLMRDLLEDENFNVTTTNYVPTSYVQIAALQPDVLILDLAIGQQAGWELLEKLHAEAATTRIPIIVVSTQPEYLLRARAQAVRYRAHGFVAKPFDLSEILALINSALAVRGPRPAIA